MWYFAWLDGDNRCLFFETKEERAHWVAKGPGRDMIAYSDPRAIKVRESKFFEHCDRVRRLREQVRAELGGSGRGIGAVPNAAEAAGGREMDVNTRYYEEIIDAVLQQGQTTPVGAGQIVSEFYGYAEGHHYRITYDASDQTVGPLERYEPSPCDCDDECDCDCDRVEPWNGLTGRDEGWEVMYYRDHWVARDDAGNDLEFVARDVALAQQKANAWLLDGVGAKPGSRYQLTDPTTRVKQWEVWDSPECSNGTHRHRWRKGLDTCVCKDCGAYRNHRGSDHYECGPPDDASLALIADQGWLDSVG